MFVPTEETVKIGQDIKSDIQGRWKPPSYFFHLKKGGHVAALKAHMHHASFIHLDIQDFFGSVNRTRVTRCLKGLYSYSEARDIASASTVIRPNMTERRFILPYGFVQSMILAALCFHKSALGNYIKHLSRCKDIAVSVYVDDIIISMCTDASAEDILRNAEAAADKSGFRLNPTKQEGPAPAINAFNIELSQNSLVITAERQREFLEALLASTNEHQQEGILGYVGSVNAAQARQLASLI
ncbi:reverse transcriptase domain-containing protein [Paraburkholderia caffeinilytica]|uniref:reverse transcriptase domain-containing protein n=1 Tax=Paraburkholderia caffeinilytica TaxID=1761016 RepID=UPI0038BC7A50